MCFPVRFAGHMLERKEEERMNVAVIYDSKTNTTQKAADYIKAGLESVEGIDARAFHIDSVDIDYVKAADGVVIGSPTYMASVTHRMLTWLQTAVPGLKLAGKLGGAFATEQYIHGGAENVIEAILTHEMVYGMMVYSGGGASGKPVIHLGPVGMSQNIEEYRELFFTYGKRFAAQLNTIR